jgi:hypothetical protein
MAVFQTLLQRETGTYLDKFPDKAWKPLIYSDNVFFFRKWEVDGETFAQWASLDGSSMEASHTFESITFEMLRWLETAFGVHVAGLTPERMAGAALGDVIKETKIETHNSQMDPGMITYMSFVLPYLMYNTVAVIGKNQLHVGHLPSGVGPTFDINSAGMARAIAPMMANPEDPRWTQPLADRPCTGILREATPNPMWEKLFSDVGVKIKVELITGRDPDQKGPDLLEIMDEPQRTVGSVAAPLDFLGFDAAPLVIAGKKAFLPVLNYKRALGSLAYTEPPKFERGGGGSHKSLTQLFLWVKLRALYLLAWPYPTLSEIITTTCRQLFLTSPFMQGADAASKIVDVINMFTSDAFEGIMLTPSQVLSMTADSEIPLFSDVVRVMAPPDMFERLQQAAKDPSSPYRFAFQFGKRQMNIRKAFQVETLEEVFGMKTPTKDVVSVPVPGLGTQLALTGVKQSVYVPEPGLTEHAQGAFRMMKPKEELKAELTEDEKVTVFNEMMKYIDTQLALEPEERDAVMAPRSWVFTAHHNQWDDFPETDRAAALLAHIAMKLSRKVNVITAVYDWARTPEGRRDLPLKRKFNLYLNSELNLRKNEGTL